MVVEVVDIIDKQPVLVAGDYVYYKGRKLPRMRGASPSGVMEGQGAAASPPAAAPRVVPFDQAAHRAMKPGPTYTVQPGASEVTLGPDPIPASSGYLRRIIIEVIGSDGSAGPGVFATDAPFNVLSNIQLADTNGAPVFELTGFNTMLADTYGRYSGTSDPRNDPDYSANVGNPRFALHIPVEIAANSLGSLANQSAAAAYQLRLKVAPSAAIWTTPPTTVPTFTIKTTLDYWTLPATQDGLGRGQQQEPPFEGTAQYWSQKPNQSVTTGDNRTQITRTGGLIRTVIFVARQNGVRSDTPFPDPFTLSWDDRDLFSSVPASILRKLMREYIPDLTVRDTGVYVFIFNYGEDRYAGGKEINSWLATVTATLLELTGTSAGAGTLDVVTNDVSVAEISPALRGVETSRTGRTPPVAPIIQGVQ